MTNLEYIQRGLKVGDKVKINTKTNYPHMSKENLFTIKAMNRSYPGEINVYNEQVSGWILISDQIIEVVTEFKIEDIYK